MIIDRGPSHISPVSLILKRGRPVHRAPIIPLHQVPNILPLHLELILRLLRMREQVPNQRRRLPLRHANDATHVARDVERLPRRVRRRLHDGVVGRRDGILLLLRRLVEFPGRGQLPRVPDPVLGDFALEVGLDVRGEVVVGGAHVGVECCAAGGRELDGSEGAI